jgi:hypothetical protein
VKKSDGKTVFVPFSAYSSTDSSINATKKGPPKEPLNSMIIFNYMMSMASP